MKSTRGLEYLLMRKFDTYKLDGLWGQALGEPETNGAWLIWGAEKNGKTWVGLMLAYAFSMLAKVLYISAEEGLGRNFIESCKRAKMEPHRNLKFNEYISINELEEILKKQRPPRIVFLDNLTIYNDEMMYGKMRQLIQKYNKTLFIFLAHEENRQPYGSSAKMCRKLAKVIMHVQGLTASIGGRCPGGVISIDEEKAQLYWGTETIKEAI